MINVKRFVNSKEGIIIISFLLGFGLATLFKKVCLGPSCIVFEGPSQTMLNNQLIKYNHKCYKNIPQHVKCSKKYKKVQLKNNDLDS
jgi:hypothetical protein